MEYIGLIFLFGVLVLINFNVIDLLTHKTESFSNFHSTNYPSFDLILTDPKFRFTGNTLVNTNTYLDIWFHYPVTQLGSYNQITNNFKYPSNPDEGTCIDANFCNVLYKNRSPAISNISVPLKPVGEPSANESRVNFYITKPLKN